MQTLHLVAHDPENVANSDIAAFIYILHKVLYMNFILYVP